MNTRVVILYMAFLVFLQSCGRRDIDLDELIKKYDTIDFSPLRGRAVSFRSRGSESGSAIYMVSADSGNCNVYPVECDCESGRIIAIRKPLDSLIRDRCILEDSEIRSIMSDYCRLHLMIVAVDDAGNAYINPYEQELPIVIRRVPGSTPRYFEEFEPYRGNWYVRKGVLH